MLDIRYGEIVGIRNGGRSYMVKNRGTVELNHLLPEGLKKGDWVDLYENKKVIKPLTETGYTVLLTVLSDWEKQSKKNSSRKDLQKLFNDSLLLPSNSKLKFSPDGVTINDKYLYNEVVHFAGHMLLNGKGLTKIKVREEDVLYLFVEAVEKEVVKR